MSRLSLPTLLLLSLCACLGWSQPADHMETIGQTDAISLLQSVSVPFSTLKEKRNQHIDSLITEVLSRFAIVGPAVSQMNKTMAEMEQVLPALHSQLFPLMQAALPQLKNSVRHVKELLQDCPNTVKSSSSQGNTFESNVFGMAGLLESILGSQNLAPGPQIPSVSDLPEWANQKQLNMPEVEGLGHQYTCDSACQENVIQSTGMAGKHVAVEDMLAAFNSVISYAMEKHRQRYSHLITEIVKTGRGVAQVAGTLQSALLSLTKSQAYSVQMQQQGSATMQQYITNSRQLRALVQQLTC